MTSDFGLAQVGLRRSSRVVDNSVVMSIATAEKQPQILPCAQDDSALGVADSVRGSRGYRPQWRNFELQLGMERRLRSFRRRGDFRMTVHWGAVCSEFLCRKFVLMVVRNCLIWPISAILPIEKSVAYVF